MTASEEPDDPFDTRWEAAWELRRTDAVAAIALAEQLREDLDAASTADDEQRARMRCCSRARAGGASAATARPCGASPRRSSCCLRSDRELYRAKHQGKDRS